MEQKGIDEILALLGEIKAQIEDISERFDIYEHNMIVCLETLGCEFDDEEEEKETEENKS